MASSLELFFSRILWLNLDRRADRRQQADQELQRLHVGNHQRISAIDNPASGNAGCTASHRLLWRRIATGEFGPRPLVLEDDFMALTGAVLLQAGYSQESDTWRIFNSLPWKPLYDAPQMLHMGVNERFDEMISYVPADWDVLYIGGQYQCEQNQRLTKHCIRAGGMLGTVAYSIRPSFAAEITEALDRSNPGDSYPGAVDMVLTSFASAHRFYMISPRLFIPRPGYSDLREEFDAFPFAYCDSRHEMLVDACA